MAHTEELKFELYISDGTEGGTSLLKDINPGAGEGLSGSFATLNDKVFFVAQDGVHGWDIWSTDGTGAGTKVVKDLPLMDNKFPSIMGTYDNQIFFSGRDPQNETKIWRTDGTDAGTIFVQGIGQKANIKSKIGVLNNKAFYYALNL